MVRTEGDIETVRDLLLGTAVGDEVVVSVVFIVSPAAFPVLPLPDHRMLLIFPIRGRSFPFSLATLPLLQEHRIAAFITNCVVRACVLCHAPFAWSLSKSTTDTTENEDG